MEVVYRPEIATVAPASSPHLAAALDPGSGAGVTGRCDGTIRRSEPSGVRAAATPRLSLANGIGRFR